MSEQKPIYSQGIQVSVNNISSNLFFAPGQPVQPISQTETLGRLWDYPIAENLRWIPRGDNANENVTSFPLLRALAQQDLVSMCIQTRQDQFARLFDSWEIVDKQTGEPAKDIDYIKDFLAYPDQERNFETWGRELCYEMLTIDAPCVFIARDEDGVLKSLEILDGATIKPIIDAYGKMPEYPNPRFYQTIKGVPANLLNSEELLYAPRNSRVFSIYGYSPVEQVRSYIFLAMKRTDQLVDYFIEGNMPASLLTYDGTAEEVNRLQKYLDSTLSGDLANRSKFKFIPTSKDKAEPKVVMTKQELLTTELDETLFRFICTAFSVNPSSLIKTNNRATSETLKETAEEEGLYPLIYWWNGFMTEKVLRVAFNRPDLAFKFNTEKETIDEVLAKSEDTYVKNGVFTPNEIRIKHNLEPVKGGDINMIYTTKGPVPLQDVASGDYHLAGDVAAKGSIDQTPIKDDVEEGIGTSTGLVATGFEDKKSKQDLEKSSKVQSLLFSTDKFSVKQAKAWAKKHGYKFADTDIKPDFIHLRQFNPTGSKTRSIKIAPGILARIEFKD